jgi:DNA-binding response OmpR family regulator
MRLAVVDDDYTAQQLISDYLEDQGYSVARFSDPEQLRQTASEYKTIIMDVMFAKDRTKGITSIKTWATEGVIRPDTLVVFVSNFGREKEINDLLAKLENSIPFKWLDKDFLGILFFTRLRTTIEEHDK